MDYVLTCSVFNILYTFTARQQHIKYTLTIIEEQWGSAIYLRTVTSDIVQRTIKHCSRESEIQDEPHDDTGGLLTYALQKIVFIINYLKLVIHTVSILGDKTHAFERTGADEPFDGSVEPMQLIDHILPDHESRTGRGATDV